MGQWGAIDVPQLGSGVVDLERGTNETKHCSYRSRTSWQEQK